MPPDLAARGLTGEVVASRVIDKLTTMQNARPISARPAQSYANNWGEQTSRWKFPRPAFPSASCNFLREWLGHDTHITGEVFRTADGIAVTARAGGEGGATFTGTESDLDALMQKAAEHVYEVTQPYRYANYLDRNVLPAGAQRVAKREANLQAGCWTTIRWNKPGPGTGWATTACSHSCRSSRQAIRDYERGHGHLSRILPSVITPLWLRTLARMSHPRTKPGGVSHRKPRCCTASAYRIESALCPIPGRKPTIADCRRCRRLCAAALAMHGGGGKCATPCRRDMGAAFLQHVP